MKRLILVLSLILTGSLAAQYNGNNLKLYHGMFEIVFYELPINGTPYIDEIFKKGEILIENPDQQMKEERLMRFNAFTGDMEYLTHSGEEQKLLKRENITVLLDGRIFEVHPYRQAGEINRAYFIPMNSGKTVLYKKPLKHFKKGAPSETGYDPVTNPEYFDASTYYLSNGKGMVEVKLKKGSLLSNLNGHRDALESFIAEAKLKVKKEADAVKLLEYYNALNSNL